MYVCMFLESEHNHTHDVREWIAILYWCTCSDEQWEHHIEGSSWGIVVLCNSVLFILLLLLSMLLLLPSFLFDAVWWMKSLQSPLTFHTRFSFMSYQLFPLIMSSSYLPDSLTCTSVLWCYTVSTGKYLPTFKRSTASSSCVGHNYLTVDSL